MFYKSSILYRSTVLDSPAVFHGFSTRAGGVSALPHTATLNLTRGLGDDEATVCRNIDIFAREVSGGRLGGEATVTAHQIHSSKVRVLTESNRREGYSQPQGEDADGFVTDCRGVMPIVRVADCVPILMRCEKEDTSPIIAAVHAGWRGTVSGIASEAVRRMLDLGGTLDSIRVAVGPHIGQCCFQVGEDFYDAVTHSQGADFAKKHIKLTKNGLYADLDGMNVDILASVGIRESQIDLSRLCTVCDTAQFYSHRGMAGKRGTLGAGIVIL